ncbi:MAG: peptidyl-alpha-hydroxyglycine alpha-amidating lyase family protein [Candidatus Limnocylindria bacterium]
MTVLSASSFEVVEGWEQLPAGYSHPDVADVAVDSTGRVYLFCRSEHPVLVYERDGGFVRSWGERLFTMRAHGITMAPDDTIWFTDDGDQTVRRFDRDGRLLATIGTSGRASDTGYDGTTVASITRGGPPFNRPTSLAVAPNGDLYVSDGYGNARVHQFSSGGELLRSWGEPGTGPGQFMLPHGVAVHPDGRVFVCDRENDRVQIFSPEGEFLEQWTVVQRPTKLVFDQRGLAIVAELCWRAGMRSFRNGPITGHRPSRLAILDPRGRVLARLGDTGPLDEVWGAADPCRAGNFCAPHGLALDLNGDLYVAEVAWHVGVSKGLVPATCHTIQKFAARA